MQRDQAADLVAGILTRNDVPFRSTKDGSVHQVKMGSTAVTIRFADWGDNDTAVNLQATVLERLPTPEENSEKYFESLDTVNEINGQLYFGKLYRASAAIVVDHDLLASRMEADELMNAMDTVLNIADDLDDKLKEDFGGLTWQDVENEGDDSEALET
jgi:hypothetical protein